ncbi:MAG: alpha/beta fold hydrolase [Thermomicrobiales bacterium]
MPRSLFRAAALMMLTLALSASLIAPAFAQTPEASQEASPDATPGASPVASPFPDTPIGRQAAWAWSALQTGDTPLPASEIEAHCDPALLAQLPADQLAAALVQVQQQYGPFTLEPDSLVLSRDEPATNARFTIAGPDGFRLDVTLAMDPTSELLTGFLISPAQAASPSASAVASPAATPLAGGVTDTEVSFTSGADTIYGSFMAPAGLAADAPRPAALIISGSGPTDRNGDSGNLPLHTNYNLAVTLADAGIPSLRYDKLGSGKTGLGSHVDGKGIDVPLYLQEAKDAAAFLATQPGVDPARLIIVGHSEGGFFALLLAQELVKAGTPPAGLILVAPLSIRYLDLFRTQLAANITSAVAAGQMTRAEGDSLMQELEGIITSLRTTGSVPEAIASPELAQIFTPANATFLAQADAIDPAEVAASLPKDLPVLVLLGEKDSQVLPDQVDHLMGGFAQAGNTDAIFLALPDANHALRIVEGTPNPVVDYANPDLPFSPMDVTAFGAFLAAFDLVPPR